MQVKLADRATAQMTPPRSARRPAGRRAVGWASGGQLWKAVERGREQRIFLGGSQSSEKASAKKVLIHPKIAGNMHKIEFILKYWVLVFQATMGTNFDLFHNLYFDTQWHYLFVTVMRYLGSSQAQLIKTLLTE